MGIAGAGSVPLRARAAEAALEGKEPTEANLAQAAREAAQGIDFLADLSASGDFRAHLTQVFARRALAEAVSRAG